MASWLSLIQSPAASAALLTMAAGAAAALAFQSYRPFAPGMMGEALLLASLRTAAWIAVLLMLARPTWRWTDVRLQRPPLWLLVDDSRSMGLADVPPPRDWLSPFRTAAPLRRIDAVRHALTAAARSFERVRELYDVRCTRLSAVGRPSTATSADTDAAALPPIDPAAPQTALAAALRYAADTDGGTAENPAAVVLISDGAENAETAAAVRAAAEQLGRRGVTLLAVGVAPPPETVTEIRLDPLQVPPRVSTRDRVQMVVSARVTGRETAAARIDVSWDARVVQSRDVSIPAGGTLATPIDADAPAAGVHLLTARVSLTSSPDVSAQVHSLVEVVEDRIRVLIVDDVPRPETAFLTRALTGDADLLIERRVIPRNPGAAADALSRETWASFDVILLGAAPRWRMTRDLLEALRAAVEQHGVGVLLAGGMRMFGQTSFAAGPLETLSPALFTPGDPTLESAPIHPDVSHPVFRLSDDPAADARRWSACPPLGRCTPLAPRPLATVLARDDAGRVLLAAHEYGAGRVAAAAWESTWTWALHSDESNALHRAFWRQSVRWLANRRPRAWVVTDAADYPLSALRAGGRSVRVRAGVSSPPGANSTSQPAAVAAHGPRLTLTADDNREREIALRPDGAHWTAELQPGAAGEYRLRFDAPDPRPPNAASAPPLRAETTFRVSDVDAELQRPTHDVELLRAAADAARAAGGAYADLPGLPRLLDELTARDPRRRVELPRRLDPVDAAAWVCLVVALALLAGEWAWRKRLGMP